MELLILAALCWPTYLGISAIAYFVRRRSRRRLTSRHATENLRRLRLVARAKRRRRALVIGKLARQFQIPLLQISQAQDFRRAAGFARLAKAVPAAFRRKQFQRFRPTLIEHLVSRLDSGGNREVLIQSLTDLIRALGVATHEADYILAEAEARLHGRRPSPALSLEDQLREAQQRHEERVQAIRALAELNDDIREQLLETEDQRCADEMLNIQPNSSSNLIR
jgi:hypothetical protein